MIPQLRHTHEFVMSEIIAQGLEVNSEKSALGTRGVLVREAEKRGWDIHEITPKIIYLQEKGIFKGALVDHTPHTTSRVGWLLARRKDLTKKVLSLNSVPTPQGRHFSESEKKKQKNFSTILMAPL
ncbi:hypothetical protein [Corynebacterium casei]|uniref:hypothetical protein n=1 Tax=Corynebacterium casei TaxID=160386 RepID=UPI003F8FE398